MRLHGHFLIGKRRVPVEADNILIGKNRIENTLRPILKLF